MARVAATETAGRVTLEAMRIHGGYGYTTDFPVERYYRDAPRLLLALGGNDAERQQLGRIVYMGGLATGPPTLRTKGATPPSDSPGPDARSAPGNPGRSSKYP
jgi:hypothetical protein